MAAAACEEGMNGDMFDGRPRLVAIASPYTIRRMGENQMNKNQQVMAQSQLPALTQKSRGSSNFGRGGGGGGGGGNWERGNGTRNRGSMGNMRTGWVLSMEGYHGQWWDCCPTTTCVASRSYVLSRVCDSMGFGEAMGRIGPGFEGFPAGAAGASFPGLMPSFPPVVAPRINPAFFGRGLAPGGSGMWSDPNMGGWGGEEQSSDGRGCDLRSAAWRREPWEEQDG
ncbi:hypothetical protein OPV22_010747 [Ensete ventricosum]|uniref:Uncharacterized protein n=1 Tax=Ensete ventricosum TaxID=4639 RepID=A0AAV8Q3C8_ENSVE|nr:hypothetical protein OPV22_010747 [Ensete ventricosum]RWV86593.1 hypothetical protein GW17_00051494 [Ensete ventricosum]